MMGSLSTFAEWIGRTETVDDDLSVAAARSAAALFDHEGDRYSSGAELPPLWHWFYFLPRAAQSALGEDGHPRRDPNSFLPPLPLPRRMFAGGRLTWHRPLLLDRPARREAVVQNVELKHGRSGPLAFVTVAYRYWQAPAESSPAPAGDQPAAVSGEQRLCLEEVQDIVYREPGPPLPPPAVLPGPRPPDGPWRRTVAPDARLLFRFSALTFNAHRIHYDRPYAVEQEGYPGLVVHGPLVAMLLLQLATDQTPGRAARYQFRSQGPLFDLAPFQISGQPTDGGVDLAAYGPDAKTAMTAALTFA